MKKPAKTKVIACRLTADEKKRVSQLARKTKLTPSGVVAAALEQLLAKVAAAQPQPPRRCKITPALREMVVKLKLEKAYSGDILEATGLSHHTIDSIWADYRAANPTAPKLAPMKTKTK